MASLCQCSGCKKYFAGVTYHEMHRVGDPHRGEERRCLTTEEMQSLGMDCEQRIVHFRRENKRVAEMHAIWFSAKLRNDNAEYFAKLHSQ